jgi:NAD-dependent deacetylase
MEPIGLSSEIRARLAQARRAVFFTGAGVSRESGLDTFRGAGGLWESMRPEELATPQAFARDPGTVWRWYAWRYGKAAAAEPNPAHRAIARFETVFPSSTVVTQNVDGLHRRAGSRRILEVHGTLVEAECEACGRRRPMGEAVEESADLPPRCSCGGRFRPAVVWFGEALPAAVLAAAHDEAGQADLWVSIGTSGVVFPAAGLIEVAKRAGAVLIEVNPEPTPFSALADLALRAPAGEAVPSLLETIERCRIHEA